MTKEEIADALRDYSGLDIRVLSEAVRALDVCTAVEREWLEASLALEGSTLQSAGPTVGEERRYQLALAALRAERTPPDPVETFIAEVRVQCDGPTKVAHHALSDIKYALDRLDSARGRK